MSNKSVKLNIRKARKSLHLTQAELAKRMNISRQSYINIESGKTEIINRYIEVMSDVTGIPEEKILFGFSWKEMNSDELQERNELHNKILETQNHYEAEIEGLKRQLALAEELCATKQKLINSLTKHNETLLRELGVKIEVTPAKE